MGALGWSHLVGANWLEPFGWSQFVGAKTVDYGLCWLWRSCTITVCYGYGYGCTLLTGSVSTMTILTQIALHDREAALDALAL